MAAALTQPVAEEISAALNRDGHPGCQPNDVWDVAKHGSVAEGVVGPEYDDVLTDAILDALDDRGIEGI